MDKKEITIKALLFAEYKYGTDFCLDIFRKTKDLSKINISKEFNIKIDAKVIRIDFTRGEGIYVTLVTRDLEIINKLTDITNMSICSI